MKIVTIEPTPSPNSMKIIVDEELPMGISHNYKKEDAETAPHPVSDILASKGSKESIMS